MPALISAEALAALAQKYDDLDQQRLQLGRELKAIEDESKGLKAQLIEQIKKAGAVAIGCKTAVFTLKEEFEPTLENISDLRDHILKTGEWELLERRISKSAIKERWEIGEKIPGVVKFPVIKLSRSGVK